MLGPMTIPEPASTGALLDRYLLGLDAGDYDDDWFRSLFTDDVVVEFPHARHEGLDGLAAFHATSLTRYAATQHFGSAAVVEVTGEKATLTANAIATHVHRPENAAACGPVFASGSRVSGEAQLTAAGWRLRRLSFRTIWITGTPPPRT